jgi:hypothetical protein
MAKSRKPNTARKPPVPSDSHADIEDWTRRVMPDLHPIASSTSRTPPSPAPAQHAKALLGAGRGSTTY